MRRKLVINLILFFVAYTYFFSKLVFAGCDGETTCGACSGRCGTQSCTYRTTFTSEKCPGGCIDYDCWDQGQVDCDAEGYWCPDGLDTACKDTGCIGCFDPINGSCVEETATVTCNCDPITPTPSPTPNPSGGTNNPTASPTPDTVIISGSTQKDLGAAFSGSLCAQGINSPLEIGGVSLTAKSSITYSAAFNKVLPSNYAVNTDYSGNNYTVTLDLSAQTGLIKYVCSCPAAIDPDNPYVCSYTGITSPGNNVNFYLKEDNLSSDSWFQVFGGNLFGRTNISSFVPYRFCADDASCQAAISVPNPSFVANLSSSGFPISNTGNATAIISYDNSTIYHSYLHLPSRLVNTNSYDTSTDLAQLSYDYFYKLVENSAQKVGNGEDLEPLLADWTNSAWWSSSDVNFIKVDGNVSIDETQGFNLASGQKLVVFVDGNLTFDDSNPNDSNRKITSVANGGFLAFFASKNVLITPNVGYELNPLVPSVPIVTNANSNLEGVFVADGNLIVQTKSAIGEVPPDRKFIGSGTFVGWNNVLLNRTFDDGSFGPILSNTQAIENFIYRPDLLANWPVKLKASISNWREIDPQLINQ